MPSRTTTKRRRRMLKCRKERRRDTKVYLELKETSKRYGDEYHQTTYLWITPLDQCKITVKNAIIPVNFQIKNIRDIPHMESPSVFFWDKECYRCYGNDHHIGNCPLSLKKEVEEVLEDLGNPENTPRMGYLWRLTHQRVNVPQVYSQFTYQVFRKRCDLMNLLSELNGIIGSYIKDGESECLLGLWACPIP